MRIIIYNTDKTILLEAYALDRSSQDWGIMTDNTLSLDFEMSECIILPPGCYVEFDGTRFFLLDEYRPAQQDTARWKYNVAFKDASSLLSVVAALNIIEGKNTPIMTLTAPAYEHAYIVISNMNRFFGDITWRLGEIVSTENIEIDYTGKYCADILEELTTTTESEWWFDGDSLNIGRCEFGERIELGYMNGLISDIECSQANETRSYAYLYPIGSTRNIDPTQYGNDRLQLPGGEVRIPMNDNGIAELVEEEAFAGIYPRYIATVSSVRTEERIGEDGSPFTIYYISDDALPFDPNEYEIAGLVKQITFQSGELMGRDFEINFSSETREIEIITQFPYDNDIQLPGGVLIPSVGDEFVIWNITMPEVYYTRASQEFLEAAQLFAADAVKDASVYKVDTDYIYIKELGAQILPGQRVRLLSHEYFPAKGYYDSRITHISRDVNNPFKVSLEISAVRAMGTLARISSNIKSNEVLIRALSLSMPAIIKSWEETAATDSTVYSARKSEKEFLNKRKGGAVQGPVAFQSSVTAKEVVTNNIHSSDFQDAGMGGVGFGVTKDANGNTVVTTDILKVRMRAEFQEAVINQITFEQGETIFTLAGCVIERVEEIGNVYRCYYDNQGGNRYSGFKVGDQARCQRYDAAYDGIIKYYWRVVAATGDNYVDLYISGVDATGLPLVDGDGIPDVGDNLVHLGNRDDKTRQSAIVVAGKPEPTILQYRGVDSFSLVGKLVTKISPNDNKFTGKVVIEAGSEGAENLGTFGKNNLIRNSGFTGDYLSARLNANSVLGSASEVFSPRLALWDAHNVVARQSEVSESGAEVVFTNGMMSQALVDNIIAGEHYILSFRAKGTSITMSVGGVVATIDLVLPEDEYLANDGWGRFVTKFTASRNNNILTLSSADAMMCEVQLERGTIASAWSPSIWDNPSGVSGYQALEYLRGAIKNGKTVVNGGLMLSRVLALFADNELSTMTAGVNGSYVSDDTPAFWAGGSLDAAIDTVQRFRRNPSSITDEEWVNLAKFVATHGGDVFMRGYIHALGGLFQGAVSIANGKTAFNTDGSGQMANGNISWDEDGRMKRFAPDTIVWTSITEYKDNTEIEDYSKGAYLDLVYDADSLTLSPFSIEGSFNGFTIMIKGIPSAYDNQKSAILEGIFYIPGIIQPVNAIAVDSVRDGITLRCMGGNTWQVEREALNWVERNGVTYLSDYGFSGQMLVHVMNDSGAYVDKKVIVRNGLIVGETS